MITNKVLIGLLKEANISLESIEKGIKPGDLKNFLKIVEKKLNFYQIIEDRLNIILDYSPCTVSWVTSDLKYIGVNKTLSDIVNISPDKFPGKEIGFFTQNEIFSNFTRSLFESEKSSIIDHIETDITDSPKIFWVCGVKFDEGKKGLIIGVDVTEIKFLETQLNFSEKLSSLGEMAASIIHEINNPLMMIQGMNYKIGKLCESGEYKDVARCSKIIDDTSDKIAKIVQGIKYFLSPGRELQMEEFEFHTIIDDALIICDGRLKHNQVAVQTEIDRNITYNGRPVQIYQIVVNLITNASDAITDLKEKWIKIHLYQENNFIFLKVIDSGSGIDLEQQEKIFNKFYTTKNKGTGIGLSLSKKIANDHGAKFYIDNDAPNTTFVIKFPIINSN